MLALGPVTPDTSGFPALREQSLTEGHNMLSRLEQNWRSGQNQFQLSGEIILGAFDHNQLIGVCGLNRDPYDPNPCAGRIRHLYVTPESRRHGVGRLLIDQIYQTACGHFDYLNTNAPYRAFGFYERVGFVRIKGVEHVTHRFMLSD